MKKVSIELVCERDSDGVFTVRTAHLGTPYGQSKSLSLAIGQAVRAVDDEAALVAGDEIIIAGLKEVLSA